MRGNQQIRRDVEAMALNNQASVAGTDAVAGVTGGLPTWLETTVMNGDGSAATAGGHNMTTGLTVKYTEADDGVALSFKL